ncbi:zinc finger protein 318-like isoform X2 [Candoia aspera]|uniref:zinc finger protein 318-like isoform X2 n=1 Tax=Candoia aspera TaxID=51853 RepID=UPI002FD8178A
MMYRSGCGRSSMISSRSKENSSSGSRCSRPGAVTSGSTRGRSPRRSRSPSPRGRRHRSPSSSRSSRRSPSPRRSSRRRSPGQRSHSPGRHSRSPGRRSPSRHSESSVEQNLRITVGNDRYGIDTPERKRLCDRLGSPVDSLSDVDRDDLADGPIFSRNLLRPRSLERYSSREENQSSPFSIRHDEDYRNRDVFLHQTDYSMNYENKPREADRDGELLRKSLYSLDDRGREPKRPRYDRDDRLLDMNIEPQGFLPGTRKYRKRSLSRSPSPTYLDEDFRELESARRKRKEEELSRNLSHELSGSSYVMTGSTNPMQSSEPRYLYRPDEAPAMPKKSILKKRVDDHSVQPAVFSSSSSSIKEPPLLSDHPLPQRSSAAPFSLEVENFLKRFNKNAVAESASKESQGSEHDWGPFSGLQQNTFPFEQNSENFLKQKEPHESTSESVDQHGDFLLPHERASQDGSGFSRILGILGVMADSTSTQEKRRRSFPDDIEDEEKFLYGDDDDDDCNISSPSTQKLTVSDGKESVNQKVSSPPPLSSSIKPETSNESRPEYEKIHNLLKTIGLDIGVAEIGKLAARTQERLHGKKSSRSPDHYSVASSKPEIWERCRNRSETHSPESSQKHALSPSGSFPSSKVMSSVTKSEHNPSKMLGHNNPADTVERSVPPISLIPSAPPSLPNLSPAPTSVSQYRVSRFSPFPATQLPQNYPSPTMPPPGYDAYGHYMAYAASGWPMYAQQADPGLTDVHGLVTLTVPPNPTRPNLRVIETVSTGKATPDIKRDESVLVQIPTAAPYSKLLPQYSQPSLRGSKERISDEKNRASRKQKVIEEMEKLKAEQETRQKKLHYLRAELNRLSKQQGELLRKKRREKDGHKDPLLIEVNRLQENIVKEIAQLKMNADAAEKKQSELDKVAQILGINIFEKSRKLSSESKDSSEKYTSENPKIQEKTSNPVKESKTDKPRGKSPKPMESSSQPPKHQLQGTSIYDYYDTGNHWCKDCNTTCGTMFDFFTHMHNKKHRQTLDPYNRPWAAKIQIEAKQEVTKRIDKIPVPAKGSEFLIPVTGYYCQLCSEFFGDQISAEQHVKSHPHNEKYKKHVDENPLYEERRNLDRQAGLSVIQETERRLKRKLCEKQKEEKDEKATKVAKKEEPKNTKELGDGNNEYEISKRKEIPNGEKCGIKLKLKKDDKEMEKKEERKEESEKESKLTTFGKFSWRKTERDEKNQGKDIAVSKEESTEEGKDKESKSQSGKQNSKPIAIRLSGKTVIPHTSPWTPVVSTSSQAKIRPNLPVPVMVLRKTAVSTVSKPAPLNTFLSIKSSGAIAKPLPVVKEGNPEIVLPPDIISKAFGGEVVVLKGSQENVKVPEKAEEGEHESGTKAAEHANATVMKAQEQADVVAKAQAKARELAAMVKEQEVSRMTKANEQSLTFERPHRRPPLLPLPPGPPLSLPLPRPPPMLFAPPPPLPPKQTVILADDMAPGVSEDDKNILAMPMCPRPLPPPTVFGEHVKKLEKKNSSLAAGNAKDLYDIFYNSSGRNPAESKLVNSTSDKGKLNPTEREKNTDLQVNSKPSSNPFSEESLCNVYTSSARTPETEEVKDEKMMTTDEENVEIKTNVEGELHKISFSDIQSTLPEANDLAKSPFHNEEEIGIPAPSEFNKKSPEHEGTELAVQIEEMKLLPLDGFNETSVSLETTEHKISDDQSITQFSEISNDLPATASDSVQNEVDINMNTSVSSEINKRLELEKPELTMQLTENNVPHLKDSKNPSELETADCKTDNSKIALPLSDNNSIPLEDLSKKLFKFEIEKLSLQPPDNNDLLFRDDSKNPLEIGREEFKISDDKELECSIAPLGDVSKKLAGCESLHSTSMSENSALPLKTSSKTLPKFETAMFKYPDEDKLAMHLLEDSIVPIKEISKEASGCEIAEFKSDDKDLAMQLPEGGCLRESGVMRYASTTRTEDISNKTQNQQKMEAYDNSSLEEIKSDLDVKAYFSNLTDRDVEREHLELAGHNSAVSQGDESPLFEMPVENTLAEGSAITEEKQIYNSSEQAASTWVSDMCVQSQLLWQPIDSSSKVNEENAQIVAQNESYSKESSVDLKLDTKEFNRFKSAVSGKSLHPSKVQNSDSELRPLNKGELDSFLTNNEQEVLNGSQLKDGEDISVVNVLESGEITNEYFVNVTTISTTAGKHEQINQFSLSCETKELQVERTEALDSISSTNEIKPSYVEFMFIKHDTQKSSVSDTELSGTEERSSIETESANFSSIQPDTGQESLDPLPTEISVGHLGEVALSFADMNTEVLNTSAADNFNLNNTYSELSFEQSTTFSLDLENEGISPKSDETKPMHSPRLKPTLELETIDFTLGNIKAECEGVGILPTEILNEVNTDSPKLETVAPICLESSKTSETDTDQPVVESKIINFVPFTPDDQEEKFCSVVSDAVIPHVVSSASKGDMAEASMPLVQLQDMSSVSKPQHLYISKGGTSDKLLWSCGKNVQSQTVTCVESILPKLKESVEVGGSGDSELYSLKNQMQTSIDKRTETEEEKNDLKCEAKNKLASEVTDKSAEHLLL